MANDKDVLRKPEAFYDRYERKPGSDKKNTHYCPGCGHGVLHKLVAEALEDFGVADRTIMISPVGCSVFVYYYFKTGNVQVAHGRAPAVATGVKRANPESIVISYQGDGDLAAIGGNNILQAANRGENITVFFVNNAIYGMTGGQMAPTTLIDQKTTTSPYGRSVENEGYPIKVCELLSELKAPAYLERTAIADPEHIQNTRDAVRKAIKAQIDNKGFSLVEVLSACPSGWKTSPVKGIEWVKERLFPVFERGVYRDEIEEREPMEVGTYTPDKDEVLEELGLKEEKEYIDKDMEDVDERYRNPSVKIAGFGGQGILLLGNMLTDACMRHNFEVSWLPSYGPEMRGGTANCHVYIQDSSIGSPVVEESNVLIAMNEPSLKRFLEKVKEGGTVFYNTSMIEMTPEKEGVDLIPIPATDIADDVGSLKVQNMVMVGAFMEKTGLIDEEIIYDALNGVVKYDKFIPMNKKAIQRGREKIREIEE